MGIQEGERSARKAGSEEVPWVMGRQRKAKGETVCRGSSGKRTACARAAELFEHPLKLVGSDLGRELALREDGTPTVVCEPLGALTDNVWPWDVVVGGGGGDVVVDGGGSEDAGLVESWSGGVVER